MKNIRIPFRSKAFATSAVLLMSAALVACNQQGAVVEENGTSGVEETVIVDPYATVRADFESLTDKSHTYPVSIDGDVSAVRLFIIASDEIESVEAISAGESTLLSSRARPDLVEANPEFLPENIKDYYGDVTGSVNEADLTYIVTYADGTKKYLAQRVYPK